MFRPSQVIARVHAILAKSRSRKPATGRLLTAQAASAGLLLLCCAGLRPVAARQSTHASAAARQQSANFTKKLEGPSGKIATLDNGIGVELLAVGVAATNKGVNWWQPDGTVLQGAPVIGANQFHHSQGPGDQYLARSLFFSIHSPIDAGASTTGYFIDPAHRLDTQGLGNGRDVRVNNLHPLANDPNTGYVTLALPPDDTHIAYRFGIAAGPWETIATTRPVFEPAIGTGPHRSALEGESVGISLDVKPTITYLDISNKGHSISLLGTHAPLGDVARRLIAFDKNDREVHLDEMHRDYGGEASIDITAAALSQIAEIRLQTRPYLWAEFKDIALQPRSGLAPMRATPASLPGYRHRFACGVTVEVDGVVSPEGDWRWWRPDGKRVPGPWKEFVHDIINAEWGPKTPVVLYTISADRSVKISSAFEILPGDDYRRSHITDIYDEEEMDPKFGRGPCAVAVQYPNGTKETTLRYGVSHGPWRTVGVLTMPADIKHAEEAPDFTKSGRMDSDVSIRMSDHPELRYRSASNQQVSQPFLPAAGTIGEDARRVVAIDKLGKSVELRIVGQGGKNGDVISLSFHQSGSLHDYNRIDLSTIKEFRLQTRPYEWAEFKHIDLTPTQ